VGRRLGPDLVRSATLDALAGRVVVGVEGDPARAAAALAPDRCRWAVRVVPAAPVRTDDGGTWGAGDPGRQSLPAAGGEAVVAPGPGRGTFVECTTALALGRQVVTAGHCVADAAPGASWSLGAEAGWPPVVVPGATLGPAVASWSGPGADQDVALVSAGPGPTRPCVVRPAGCEPLFPSSQPIQGEPVVKEGATTGEVTGTVTAAEATVALSTGSGTEVLTRAVEASTCSLAGDSGGLLFEDVGGGADPVGVTDGSSGGCGPGAVSFFTNWALACPALGLAPCPVQAPGPPTGLLAQPAVGSVALVWAPPATWGTAPGPRGYLVTRDGAVVGRTTATSFVVTGLPDSTTSRFGVVALAGSLASASAGVTATTPAGLVALARSPDGRGLWLAADDGAVFALGDAPFPGSLAGRPLNAPVVALAPAPGGPGVWLAGRDGGVFALGGAPYLGSMAGRPLNAGVVGLAPTPDRRGYWLVAADGGVFCFGDARYLGSMAGRPLNAGVVGLAPTPDGRGYWLVAADGGVFAFGDAPYLGTLPGPFRAGPVVALAPTADGRGYWLATAEGEVGAVGDAAPLGSALGRVPGPGLVALAPTPDGRGAWLAGADGAVVTLGDAPALGSLAGRPL
jgi:hypothetical protein